MGFDRALSSRTPCWSHQPRTNHGPWGGRSLPSALPYATPKKDVLTTHCAQSTFMGYYPQGRMHTRCNHDTEKSDRSFWLESHRIEFMIHLTAPEPRFLECV